MYSMFENNYYACNNNIWFINLCIHTCYTLIYVYIYKLFIVWHLIIINNNSFNNNYTQLKDSNVNYIYITFNICIVYCIKRILQLLCVFMFAYVQLFIYNIVLNQKIITNYNAIIVITSVRQ